MNLSPSKLNSNSNELETVNEESTIKDTNTNDVMNQERNSRLDILSKAKGVKRLSLIKHSITAQSQPQTPSSCPNRSPLSCFNTSVNGPTSAVETNKILTFREVDHPTSVIASRKISQNIQSSSAAASSLTSLTNTSRPPLSLLGILAAKRITRKFLSTLADEKHQRRLSTFSRLSSYSPASYNLINYLPTFQLGPKEIFNVSNVKPRIEQLVQSRIESLPSTYERFKANRLCISLANEIKAMLKAHGEERYFTFDRCYILPMYKYRYQ
ncbi:E3 ubiquitin-protein ligase MARCHF3, variant 3 [Schistosoma haematobium]|uniref:E3 ubiquitin-protein ligase MARCHF3, variant 3 n=1 Tax=Schistosoma haematobium TaxID=6185 RepID=A0A922IJ80_SCHHA|nr:E3 ubiquitin-protein ligase MARCHF3, variant 3 [Schistosoma haematobium]KAH9580806.1 E3 ubiquitin-protein ligase MARCHF3, variant 3 [Schistosoma haematobium]